MNNNNRNNSNNVYWLNLVNIFTATGDIYTKENCVGSLLHYFKFLDTQFSAGHSTNVQ